MLNFVSKYLQKVYQNKTKVQIKLLNFFHFLPTQFQQRLLDSNLLPWDEEACFYHCATAMAKVTEGRHGTQLNDIQHRDSQQKVLTCETRNKQQSA
jgi:hypothetical protein